jgi:IclR family mhp operon transcriptional activator
MRPGLTGQRDPSRSLFCLALPISKETARLLGEAFAAGPAFSHSYSPPYRRVEFRTMPLRSVKVEAAARTLVLLEELNRHRVASIHLLHQATGLPKSTIVRLMKSLCAMGYVANDRRQGGYKVASRVKSLSNGFHGDPLVVEAARPWALAFTAQYHWPIAIAVLDGTSVVVRFSTIPDGPVSPFHGTINMRLSLLRRALGRAYLAFCPADERSMLLDLLSRSREPEDQLVGDRRRTHALLASIRKQGRARPDGRTTLIRNHRYAGGQQRQGSRDRRHDLFHVGT